MAKLFLSSLFASVAGAFPEFAGEPLEGKTVTFIPTASLVEKITFYVDDGRKALERLGMIVDELDVSTATPEEASDAIRRNDYIYVTGGNTFYLLRELRRSGAGAMIVDAIKAGKPYIGESAGSVILAPSIEYVRHMDDPAVAEGLSDFTSLGAVTFYPLPHVGNFPFKKAAQTIIDEYSSTLELKAINNSQVILVSGDQVSVEKGAKLSKKSLGKGVMKFLSETSCMQRRIGKPPLE
jgi:dipeptidase E